MRLRIRHTTIYRYSQEVVFGPHQLMIRPREEHDLRIETSRLEISPAHTLRWRSDAYGNAVALVHLHTPAAELRIDSEVTVKHFEPNPFNFLLEPDAVAYPFRYAAREEPDLAPCLVPLFPADEEAVRAWVAPFLPAQARATTPTLDFLTAVNQAVSTDFTYRRRDEPGIQAPSETLAMRSGSCRDYATLFMEACRHLGLAARFVSGYAHNPRFAHGSTHAWTEVYLPGAGWKGFDPTAGILACDLHVPVAVARDPAQATPVSGSFSTPGECIGHEVDVQVQEIA
jgi:transglutaminase-like putative cysteine protease